MYIINGAISERTKEMANNRIAVAVIILLCCSVVLTGCNGKSGTFLGAD